MDKQTLPHPHGQPIEPMPMDEGRLSMQPRPRSLPTIASRPRANPAKTGLSERADDIVSHAFAVKLIGIRARQLCRRRDFSKSDYDDLCQEMRAYLVEKAALFDPGRGNIEAFVTNALNTWVAMQLRHRDRRRRRKSYETVSLDGTPIECEGDVVSLGSVLLPEDGRRMTQTDPISPTERLELRDALAHVMRRLDPKDRRLLAEVAEHGVAGASRNLGVSRRQIYNALARLRPMFKKALGHDD